MAGAIACLDGTSEPHEIHFTLIGLVGSTEFQLCLAIIEYLHKRLPHRFRAPFIRPMLEFDWAEYITKAQRMYGEKLWTTDNPFIMFANQTQIASAAELQEYISQWFVVKMDKDFECLALHGVAEMYEKYQELGRKFVFFSLAVNGKYVGSLIIMLYHDILPETCKMFLKRCQSRSCGYCGTRVHRIMNRGWIQFADFLLPIDSMANENYVVPHNRRGVLSMCSNRPHVANKTQFFITLDSTPWMDYRYVALGQVMQGEYVLRHLENLPTTYDYPSDIIRIINCGEFNMEDTAMAKHLPRIQKYIEDRGATASADVVDVRDAPSVLLQENYRSLRYAYFDDYCSHFPLNNVDSTVVSEPSQVAFTPSVSGEDGNEETPFWISNCSRYIYERIQPVVSPKDSSHLRASQTGSNVMESSYDIKKYVSMDLKALKGISRSVSLMPEGGSSVKLTKQPSIRIPKKSYGASKVSFAASLAESIPNEYSDDKGKTPKRRSKKQPSFVSIGSQVE